MPCEAHQVSEIERHSQTFIKSKTDSSGVDLVTWRLHCCGFLQLCSHTWWYNNFQTCIAALKKKKKSPFSCCKHYGKLFPHYGLTPPSVQSYRWLLTHYHRGCISSVFIHPQHWTWQAALRALLACVFSIYSEHDWWHRQPVRCIYLAVSPWLCLNSNSCIYKD